MAGPPIWVPADADSTAMEGYRQEVEAALNAATARAYAIAEGRAEPALWSAEVIATLEARKAAAEAARARGGADEATPQDAANG